MSEEKRLCANRECEPPFGDKEDCEFYDDGRCAGLSLEDIYGLDELCDSCIHEDECAE